LPFSQPGPLHGPTATAPAAFGPIWPFSPEVSPGAARAAAALSNPPQGTERASLLAKLNTLSDIPFAAAALYIEFLHSLESPPATVSPLLADAAQRAARGFLPPVIAATLQARQNARYNFDPNHFSSEVVNPAVALQPGEVPDIVRDLARGGAPPSQFRTFEGSPVELCRLIAGAAARLLLTDPPTGMALVAHLHRLLAFAAEPGTSHAAAIAFDAAWRSELRTQGPLAVFGGHPSPWLREHLHRLQAGGATGQAVRHGKPQPEQPSAKRSKRSEGDRDPPPRTPARAGEAPRFRAPYSQPLAGPTWAPATDTTIGIAGATQPRAPQVTHTSALPVAGHTLASAVPAQQRGKQAAAQQLDPPEAPKTPTSPALPVVSVLSALKTSGLTPMVFSWRIRPAELVRGCQRTPINGERLISELAHRNLVSPAEASFLHDGLCGPGFQPGFSTGWVPREGEHSTRRHVANLPSATDHPGPIDAYICAERAAGRLIGPFSRPPIAPHRAWGQVWVSPLGAVPKGDPSLGKFRTIFHLSHGQGGGANGRIPPALGKTVFPTFVQAARAIDDAGPDAHLALFDVQAAFRLLPLHHEAFARMVMCWEDKYFVDTCVPFGLRTGPALYNKFGELLERLLRHVCGPHVSWMRMLDDHFIIGASGPACGAALDTALGWLHVLGVPIAHEKTAAPSRTGKFLGYLWNTATGTVSLDPRRWLALRGQLSEMVPEDESPVAAGQFLANVQQLRKLVGKLCWASRVVPRGKIHLSSLFTVLGTQGLGAAPALVAKKRWLQLPVAARAELCWWWGLMRDASAAVNPPSILIREVFAPPPPDILAWTDASGWGLGAVWFPSPDVCEAIAVKLPASLRPGSRHLVVPPAAPSVASSSKVPPGAGVAQAVQPAATTTRISSTWYEWAAILAAIETWGQTLWRGRRVTIRCDNQAVVAGWRRQHSHAPAPAMMVREVEKVCSRLGIVLSIVWVHGTNNPLADALSRGQVLGPAAFTALPEPFPQRTSSREAITLRSPALPPQWANPQSASLRIMLHWRHVCCGLP
jgi:hypothetical protein